MERSKKFSSLHIWYIKLLTINKELNCGVFAYTTATTKPLYNFKIQRLAWWNHTLNLTNYCSTNVYNNKINIVNLLWFEVIIFKSGFQMLEQVCMRIYTRGHFCEAYKSSSIPFKHAYIIPYCLPWLLLPLSLRRIVHDACYWHSKSRWLHLSNHAIECERPVMPVPVYLGTWPI